MGASFVYMGYTVNQNLVGLCSSDTETHTHTHISMCNALNLQMFYIFSQCSTLTRKKIGCSENMMAVNTHAHGQQETVRFEETMVTT